MMLVPPSVPVGVRKGHDVPTATAFVRAWCGRGRVYLEGGRAGDRLEHHRREGPRFLEIFARHSPILGGETFSLRNYLPPARLAGPPPVRAEALWRERFVLAAGLVLL